MSDSHSGRSEVKARSRAADPTTEGEKAAEEAAARERREMLSARAPAIAMRAIATEGRVPPPDRDEPTVFGHQAWRGASRQRNIQD